jgi:NTE family protein
MTLGLILGGGGARGAAHLGVLIELERLGVRPDIVTGTSIGGIVGALLAFGLSVQEMHRFFTGFTFGEVYMRPEEFSSLVSNKKLREKLEAAIGRPDFKDLQLPFAVVTTDLRSQEEVVIAEGDVVTAVLATAAIPPALPPVRHNGRILIDGGVLNNVPVDVAVALGADKTIAIDITSNTVRFGDAFDVPSVQGHGFFVRSLTRVARQPIWQIMLNTVDIAVQNGVKLKLQATPPDVLIRPNLGTIGLFDFHRLEEGIQVGREAAREHESAILELTNKPSI